MFSVDIIGYFRVRRKQQDGPAQLVKQIWNVNTHVL